MNRRKVQVNWEKFNRANPWPWWREVIYFLRCKRPQARKRKDTTAIMRQTAEVNERLRELGVQKSFGRNPSRESPRSERGRDEKDD